LDNKGGQVIVVSGSSGGIGGSVVKSFIKDESTVIGIDKDGAAKEKFSKDAYYHFDADITNEDDIRIACAKIRNLALPPPAHAILVAGGTIRAEIRDKDEEPDPLNLNLDLFRKSVDRNLTGQYICIKHLVPLLQLADVPGLAGVPDRSITLVSSINSMGDFGYPAYSAAKAGLAGLTKSLAVPLGRLHIRINAVAFGTVQTEYAEQAHTGDAGHFDRLKELAALDRLSTSEEAAQVLVMLTKLSSVTGTIITADCGQAVPGNHTR
jgi:NAD(P)-dependent dehydrogenase (short-subunit alcohol dehydrogenase family)